MLACYLKRFIVTPAISSRFIVLKMVHIEGPLKNESWGCSLNFENFCARVRSKMKILGVHSRVRRSGGPYRGSAQKCSNRGSAQKWKGGAARIEGPLKSEKVGWLISRVRSILLARVRVKVRVRFRVRVLVRVSGEGEVEGHVEGEGELPAQATAQPSSRHSQPSWSQFFSK